MVQLDPQVIGFLAIIAGILVQVVKGLLPEHLKRWIPLGLILLLLGIGAGLASYVGRDPVAGSIEGFFAAASAVGLYESLASLPGVSRVVNSGGWLQRRDL